jgi:hypothetical protein
MGIASNPRNRQMIRCLRQMVLITRLFYQIPRRNTPVVKFFTGNALRLASAGAMIEFAVR